jgi:hypothetical protein
MAESFCAGRVTLYDPGEKARGRKMAGRRKENILMTGLWGDFFSFIGPKIRNVIQCGTLT